MSVVQLPLYLPSVTEYCCCDLMADFSTSLRMLLTDQEMSPVTQKSDSKHKTHTPSLSLSLSLPHSHLFALISL